MTVVCRCPEERAVVVERRLAAQYPSEAPFDPGYAYPEVAFLHAQARNDPYDMVRSAFVRLGLDAEHVGQPSWNPLGELVCPGDTVLIKPNLLFQCRKGAPDEWLQLVTHGSVVRAVADYVLIALRGEGSLIIADGPQYDADWRILMDRTGLEEVRSHLAARTSAEVSLLDLRDKWLDCRGDVKYAEYALAGDPRGAVDIDLGMRSRLCERGGDGRYHGSDYDRAETNAHHTGGRHEYRLAATAVQANVLINIPKMKTHKKVGVTLSLKNLVGVNSGRNWMPHFTVGAPSTGGDQFPDHNFRTSSEGMGISWLQRLAQRYPATAPIFRAAKSAARPFFGDTTTTIRSGNWFGNDTCWRMVHDINRALLHYDASGVPTTSPKRYLSIVDGIIAGDGRGPEDPDAVNCGLLIVGTNPVAVDCVATKIMGFDPQRLPILARAFEPHDIPLARFGYEDILIHSNVGYWQGPLTALDPATCCDMRPHFGWRGTIELRQPKQALE